MNDENVHFGTSPLVYESSEEITCPVLVLSTDWPLDVFFRREIRSGRVVVFACCIGLE